MILLVNWGRGTSCRNLPVVLKGYEQKMSKSAQKQINVKPWSGIDSYWYQTTNVGIIYNQIS